LNKQRAQVFIATTQGLVQVKSIVRLSDPLLHSVVTISNTSQLAGISRGYQHFVAKPQGIISEMFGGMGYRLNLSNGIDQGESWQLGVFLAHYLFEHNCLSDNETQSEMLANDSSVNDIIFIATGRIDTLHYQVLAINELEKKCLHANRQIAQWQSKQQQICFLAPSHNFRQPIPNSLMKLTPIANLSELFHLCSLYGLSTQVLHITESIDATATAQIETVNSIDDYNQSVIIEANLIDNEVQSSQAQNSHLPRETSTASARFFARLPIVLFLFLGAILVWSMATWTSLIDTSEELDLKNNTNAHNDPIEYIVAGEISQNRASCSLANSIAINQGDFTFNSQSIATNLDNLCGLFLVTDKQVNSLWLVSDTKAIIVLNGLEISQQAFKKEGLLVTKDLLLQQDTLIQWAVPLPTNKNQTRQFTLLAFLQPPDEADMSSLDSYLFQLHQQSKVHSIKELQSWIDKTQSNNKVFMLEQELTIYR
jgi:hypothetical protein